jgi:ParB family chromosome partitioning protein
MIAKPISIKITEIKIGERYRSDLGDIASLADSIKTHGLIQPVVIDLNHNLVAGRRRLAAHEMLGLQEVLVVYKEVLTEGDRVALEVEENVRREDTPWQDNVQAVARIHQFKFTEQKGQWTERDTAAFIGYSQTMVNFARKLAREIQAGNKEVIESATLTDALKTLAKKAEDLAQIELAKRTLPAAMSPKVMGEHATLKAAPTIKPTDASDLIAGLVDTAPLSIPLSSMLFNAPWEEQMVKLKGQFQHIICDPPYGIDVSFMEQNTGMENIKRIEDTHQVEDNHKMLLAFISAAYDCLPEHGFLIMWHDYTLWEQLCDTGRTAGFKVQRWPFIWAKTHQCMNNAAQYNTTKNHEPAILMRKGKALMPNPVQSSWVTASNDEAKKKFKHPFAKPFEVWKPLIEAVTIPGETILDPFAGCGSSTIAALSLNRKALAIEKDPTHFPSLIENVSDHFKSRFNSVKFE